MRGRALLVAAVLALLRPAPRALADLVVFEDGRVVKAASWKVSEDAIEIYLSGGGSFTADLSRVDRIVEDEVVSADEAARETPKLPELAYDLSYRPGRKTAPVSPWQVLVEREAKRQNLDAALVAAVIKAESNGNPRSVSRKGARGLMQLMPATARRLNVLYPFDPEQNVRGGVRYLKELAERFANRPELILAAYNAGEAAVESYGGVPPYRETLGYVQRVLSWWTPAAAPGRAAAHGAGSPQ
jgi:soluble lytic murein transglycosylase-like protein